MEENKVVPLFGQTAINTGLEPPEPTPRRQDDSRRNPKATLTPPVSPDMVAAQARYFPKCYVCGGPTRRGNYCPAHPAQYYRFIECSEPGCTAVTVRRMQGHNKYTCPAHRKPALITPGKGPDIGHQPVKASPITRQRIREMIDKRKADRAKEEAQKKAALTQWTTTYRNTHD